MTTSTQNESRVFIFDLLRIVLILLVVHLHIRNFAPIKPDFLSNKEYYAVPIFLVLSFYLTAKYYLNEPIPLRSLVDRIKRLLVPLIFWSCVGFLVQPYLFSLSAVFTQLLTGQVVNKPLYYLDLLILFTVICYLFTRISFSLRVVLYLCIAVIAFLLQYSLISYNLAKPHDWLTFGRIVELVPYVVLGLFFGLIKTYT